LQEKQKKAIMHNEQVSDRVAQVANNRARAVEALIEDIQVKTKQAAANRGNALLRIV